VGRGKNSVRDTGSLTESEKDPPFDQNPVHGTRPWRVRADDCTVPGCTGGRGDDDDAADRDGVGVTNTSQANVPVHVFEGTMWARYRKIVDFNFPFTWPGIRTRGVCTLYGTAV
jgi:hypothetical protein